MSSTLKIAILALVAVAAALAGMWLARLQRVEPPALEHATLLPAARALPDFHLLDQASRPFGPERLTGHWSLLFFGFTNCPDICPSALATLAAARRELADLPAAGQPEVIFVTVDPGRDTAQRLAGYLAFFDPSFTGVTGDPAAIAQFGEALGVATILGPVDAAGNYTVDHSAAIFLVNPDAGLVAIFGAPHTPDGLTHDYRLILDYLDGHLR